jgi:PAS domain-containing protein
VSSPTVPEPDFRLLFQATRGCNLALTPDLAIVAASDAYLRAIGLERKAAVGRYVLDALGELQPAYALDLRAALCRVIAQRQAGVMALQTLRRKRPGGREEERTWSPSCSPVFEVGGRLAYILHCIEDVTEMIRMPVRARALS